jgi:Peptidase inhibitor I78 family
MQTERPLRPVWPHLLAIDCAPAPRAPATARCSAAKAQWAVGERAIAELLEQARVAAAAGSARFLRPSEPVTMEYLDARLNLGLDAKDVVRTAVCG